MLDAFRAISDTSRLDVVQVLLLLDKEGLRSQQYIDFHFSAKNIRQDICVLAKWDRIALSRVKFRKPEASLLLVRDAAVPRLVMGNA